MYRIFISIIIRNSVLPWTKNNRLCKGRRNTLQHFVQPLQKETHTNQPYYQVFMAFGSNQILPTSLTTHHSPHNTTINRSVSENLEYILFIHKPASKGTPLPEIHEPPAKKFPTVNFTASELEIRRNPGHLTLPAVLAPAPVFAYSAQQRLLRPKFPLHGDQPAIRALYIFSVLLHYLTISSIYKRITGILSQQQAEYIYIYTHTNLFVLFLYL